MTKAHHANTTEERPLDAEIILDPYELDFTNVTARFDGIVDRLHQQLGSLVDKGDILTTLSDNSTMWVYFNVREAAYLEYMASREQHKDERIELVLANHTKFKYPSTNIVIEAKFNNETGNIPFRVDFPNPDGLLRHGQTGTVLLPVVMKDAVVIPQRAVFEVLDKRYVYVVGLEMEAFLQPVQVLLAMEGGQARRTGLCASARERPGTDPTAAAVARHRAGDRPILAAW